MAFKYVAYCPASDAEKSTSRYSVKKPCNKHCLYVLGHGTWDEPYKKGCEGCDVDYASPEKLDDVSSRIKEGVSNIAVCQFSSFKTNL